MHEHVVWILGLGTFFWNSSCYGQVVFATTVLDTENQPRDKLMLQGAHFGVGRSDTGISSRLELEVEAPQTTLRKSAVQRFSSELATCHVYCDG